ERLRSEEFPGAGNDFLVLAHADHAISRPIGNRNLHVANAEVAQRRRIIAGIVGGQRFPGLSTKKVIDRLSQHLPFCVPHRNVDSRDSTLRESATTIENRRPRQLLADYLSLKDR